MKIQKRMIRTLVTFVLCIFVIVSCRRNAMLPEGKVFPCEAVYIEIGYKELGELLDNAYAEESKEKLKTFFATWGSMVPAYTSQQEKAFTDTLAEAIQIFKEYYSPTNLSRLSEGAHENFETNFRYLVIQNQLNIAVVDTNPKYYYYYGVNIIQTKILDFRPRINIPGFSAVFLTPQADSIIYRFLFNQDQTYKDDHQKRVKFLRQAMQLTHHHWIADYHKATMPVAREIILNDTFTKALVNFRIFYQFGEAYLEKRDGIWELVSSKLTGIE